MQRGYIYHHREFQFKDGYSSPKLIILLTNPSSEVPALFVKTTSQQKDKPAIPGCMSDRCLYFIAAGKAFFQKNTWVQLYEVYEIADMENDPCAAQVGMLDSAMIDDIVKCLLNSDADDIMPRHRKILGRRGDTNRPGPSDDSLRELAKRFSKR